MNKCEIFCTKQASVVEEVIPGSSPSGSQGHTYPRAKTMAKKSETNENSVNVALQELMGMEDDRQRIADEERRKREEEERKGHCECNGENGENDLNADQAN